MDANGAKAPQEPKGIPSMMEEMRTMCCSEEFSPADMCLRMSRFMGRPSDAEAPSDAESGTTSDERRGNDDNEAHRRCCGPLSRCAPKRP